ncbi:FBP domain-containing protein [Calidifontibacter terrae]
MQPLTEAEIRASFVNTSKREVSQATLPRLDEVPWDRIELLGWRDEKRPQLAYVVVETDDGPVGVLLRTAPPTKLRRRMLCSWCQDTVTADDALLYVARRAGAAGRKGNTIGTSICTNFGCSANVRRTPTVSEVGSDDPTDRERWMTRRIDVLLERSRHFIGEVLTD